MTNIERKRKKEGRGKRKKETIEGRARQKGPQKGEILKKNETERRAKARV